MKVYAAFVLGYVIGFLSAALFAFVYIARMCGHG